jgi:hypothetical protein
VTLLELLKEIRDMNALDRVRRIKVGDVELELAAPVDTETRTVELAIPQEHGVALNPEAATRAEEAELLAGVYGAGAGGWTPEAGDA